MRELSGAVFDAQLVEQILPLVPGVIERLERGIDVADVGTGCGRAVNLMGRAFPNSRFVGFDFSESALATARSEAASWGLGNVKFEARDAARLDFESAFDLITTFELNGGRALSACCNANVAWRLWPRRSSRSRGAGGDLGRRCRAGTRPSRPVRVRVGTSVRRGRRDRRPWCGRPTVPNGTVGGGSRRGR